MPSCTFGGYARRGQLLDLSPLLDSAFGDRFTPTAWRAVQNQDKPYGVPHHTDTSPSWLGGTMPFSQVHGHGRHPR